MKKPINRVVYALVWRDSNDAYHVAQTKSAARFAMDNQFTGPGVRQNTVIRPMRLVDARKFDVYPKVGASGRAARKGGRR